MSERVSERETTDHLELKKVLVSGIPPCQGQAPQGQSREGEFLISYSRVQHHVHPVKYHASPYLWFHSTILFYHNQLGLCLLLPSPLCFKVTFLQSEVNLPPLSFAYELDSLPAMYSRSSHLLVMWVLFVVSVLYCILLQQLTPTLLRHTLTHSDTHGRTHLQAYTHCHSSLLPFSSTLSLSPSHPPLSLLLPTAPFLPLTCFALCQ